MVNHTRHCFVASLPIELFAIAIVAMIALPHSARAQDYRYAVIELPRLSDHYWAGAAGINSNGDCVGFTALGPLHIHAVLWPSSGGIVDLGTLGGDNSSALSINENNEIVGWAGYDPNKGFFDHHAFLWQDGQMYDLGTLGGMDSYAYAINDKGVVVGESEYDPKHGREKAFLWENGQMRALPAPHPDWDGRAAFDINNSGEVVGYGLDTNSAYHALLWRGNEVVDLGTLGGSQSRAHGINNHGVIVGSAQLPSEDTHSVKWINGKIIDIHTESAGRHSLAYGINNNDQVVGAFGYILNPGENIIFLNDLVPPKLRLDWNIEIAKSINDAGQIPITGYHGSDSWALLLTPITPTMNLQGPQPGIAGERNGLRITNVTPGQRVFFYYSRNGGGARIPDCDLQQNALQLHEPKLIGSAIANQNGIATIAKTVPNAARNQWILMQAVVPNECAISQLVVHRFE